MEDDIDYLLALSIQEKEDMEHEKKKIVKSTFQNKKVENGSLIDPEWELVDPNPNIYELFISFNNRFFWESLGGVEVKWSPRMYSCAGICSYKGKGGCVISLSLPLLKFRPRKDLIETLLHEMIHAYLFVTNNFKDRSDHGPKFCAHMKRINSEAGTSISVYHTFHDEVKFYLTHWWRCNGPCKNKPPYFGLVKRSMNRAPGPNDIWFASHQNNCGGTFIKVKEPDGFKPRKRKNTENIVPKCVKAKDLTHYFPTTSPNRSEIIKKPPQKTTKISENQAFNSSKTNISGVGKNVVQFSNLENSQVPYKPKSSKTLKGGSGTSGIMSNRSGTMLLKPKTVSSTSEIFTSPSVKSHNSQLLSGSPRSLQNTASGSSSFSGTGYVLGLGNIQENKPISRLLDLFPSSKTNHKDKIKVNTENSLEKSVGPEANYVFPTNDPKSLSQAIFENCNNLNEYLEKNRNDHVNCPVCNKQIKSTSINEHLDVCVQLDDDANRSVIILDDDANRSVIILDDGDSEDVEDQLVCPCCQHICANASEMDLHLNSCLVFDDAEFSSF